MKYLGGAVDIDITLPALEVRALRSAQNNIMIINITGFHTNNSCVSGLPSNIWDPSITEYVAKDEEGTIYFISPPLHPQGICRKTENIIELIELYDAKGKAHQYKFIKYLSVPRVIKACDLVTGELVVLKKTPDDYGKIDAQLTTAIDNLPKTHPLKKYSDRIITGVYMQTKQQGEVKDFNGYIVTPFVQGATLDDHFSLDEAQNTSKSDYDLTDRVLPLLKAIMETGEILKLYFALGYAYRDAHSSNIMIRNSDLKPVLVDQDWVSPLSKVSVKECLYSIFFNIPVSSHIKFSDNKELNTKILEHLRKMAAKVSDYSYVAKRNIKGTDEISRQEAIKAMDDFLNDVRAIVNALQTGEMK